MKFRYYRLPSKITKHIDIPMIPIGLNFGQYPCLVDSGSDYSFLHGVIGEALGLNVTEGTQIDIGGITGNRMIAYFHKIHFNIGGWDFNEDYGFSYELGTDLGILGRDILFNKYKVIFNQRKKIVELKDYTDY